jgi:hypothetical protein
MTRLSSYHCERGEQLYSMCKETVSIYLVFFMRQRGE